MDSVVDAYPLNSTHRGILFHSLQSNEADVYLSVISLRIQGALDTSFLQQAWQYVFRHHTSLRSAVVFDGLDEPLWVVHDSIKPDWEFLDFTSLTTEERESRERNVFEKLAQTQFEFAAEALMKFTLIRIDDSTHRLLWTVHHILSDGWSTSVVLEDVSTAYAACIRGDIPSLPPTLEYGRFLNAQSSLNLDPLKAYWSGYLESKEPTPLKLIESVRNADQTKRFAIETRIRIDERLSSDIAITARRYETTTNVLLVAAWGFALRDLCQHESPLFGVTLSGRSGSHSSIERGVGLYASTLPLCVDTADTQSLKEWLSDISKSLQTHAEHDAVSLFDVKKLSKHAGNDPLFSSVVALAGHQNDLCFGSTIDNDIQIDSVDCQIRSHFDVSLLISSGVSISLNLISQTDKLDEASNNAILRRYVKVLELLVDSTCTSVPELRQRWSNVKPDNVNPYVSGSPPQHKRIDDWIMQAASQQPWNLALLQGQKRVTYAELEQKTRQLSRALGQMVRKTDRPIAICLSNSINAIMAMIGVLLSGRCYLPIDPDQPIERKAQLCNDADCALIIVDQPYTENSSHNNDSAWPINSNLSPLTVTLEALFSRSIAEVSDVNPPPAHNEQSLAYLMYTSGSTGAPKGVVISHANLVYSTQARFDFYPGEVEKFLLVSPLHFDSSVVGLYWTLCGGGTIVLPEQQNRNELAHWSELIREFHISHTLCLPSVYKLLIEQSDAKDLKSLKSVIVAGEPSHADLCTAHYRKLPNTVLYNEYGPTEACVWSSVHRCGIQETDAVPIGQPIPGTSIKVIGIDNDVCPDGVVGELQLFSPGVAGGYYKQPELTSQSFLSNPAGYKSGDLGYYSRNGQLFCTGRVDRQIKIRGQRIEPGEVEIVVRHITGVREVRVFSAARDAEGGKRLWLAYTPQTLSVGQIRSIVQSQLPPSMWPFGYFALESLPTLSNGKVSEQKLIDLLPTIQLEEFEAQTAVVESAIGSELLEMVNTLLGENKASINNNAVQCGLDSIDAMKLTAQLRKRFEVDLRLASVLESRNWGELGSLIDSLVNTGAETTESTAVTADAQELPLSVQQLSLWYLDQTGLQPEVYAVQSTFRCIGKLCSQAVNHALNALVHQHHILRTRLRVNDNGDAYQVVMPPEPVLCSEIDQVGSDLTWEQARDRQLNQRFDLANDQLLRALIYRYNNEDQLLMFHSHHIAMDGWSFDVFHAQFVEHYCGYIEAQSAEGNSSDNAIAVSMPAPDEYQYSNYTLWQQSISPQVLESETEHWCQVLAEPRQTLDLAYDFCRPARPSFKGGSVIRSIDLPVTRSWQMLARETQSTPFMVALAAVKTGLRVTLGVSDLLIGTPVSNRIDPRWQSMLGFFGNTAVIRTKSLEGDTFIKSVLQTRSAILDALEHESVPFDHIVRSLGLQGSANRHPLFDVFFMYKHQYETVPHLPDVNVEHVNQSELTTAKFDLAIEIRPRSTATDSGYELHLNYSTDLFHASTIERMATELLTVMSATTHHSNKPVVEIKQAMNPVYGSVLPKLQMNNVLSNDDAGLLVNQRLDQVFHKQCLSYPQSIALQHNDHNICYAELNQLVDRIAECLHQSGIGPGAVVAVSLPRSIHQIAAALAVSRCEAVWCPVDPEYPQTRKRYMYADSGSHFLITAPNAVLDQSSQASMLQIVIDPGENPVNVTPCAVAKGDKKPQLVDRVATGYRHKNRTAVLMYTSGSMGNPKGVLLGHQAMMNRFIWMWNRYPFANDDVNVIKTSSSFVDSLWESFGALLSGTPSVLINNSDVTDIECFVRKLRSNKVTRLLVVPSLLTAILDWLTMHDQYLPDLKLCSCSGEVLPPQLATRLLTRQPDTRLLNLYGSTEVAADVTCQEIVIAQESEKLPLGSAIDGISMFILDDQHKVLAPGSAGEIAFAGAGLAISYHNDAELTASKFVEIDGVGSVFLTGDMGHIDNLGRLHFDGRNDRQVKIRGVRVNCHEIEHQINSVAGVAHSLVFAQGELDERYLCAVVQRNDHTDDSERLDNAALLSQLQEILPENQLPDRFHLVDTLPLLPNGKPDRVAATELTLKPDGLVSDGVGSDGVGPDVVGPDGIGPDGIEQTKKHPASNVINHRVTKPEETSTAAMGQEIQMMLHQPMLAIWQDTLKNHNLTVDDDFFEAGGYSLLAVKLVMRLNSEVLAQHSVKMTIGDLLEKRTVSRVALQLQRSINRTDTGLSANRTNVLMTLRTGTGSRKLFMVPPFGDTGFFFSKFATCVPNTISVFSFDMAISVDHDSLQSLCTALVDELLIMQPNGPWVIVAGCLGNVLAFEMAHQLKARTGTDCDLYLIDSKAPKQGPGWEREPERRTGLNYYWAVFCKQFNEDYCRNLIRIKVRQLRAVFDKGIRKYLDVRISQSNQFVEYQAKEGSADITFFRSSTYMNKPYVADRWAVLTTGGFNLHDFPNITHEKLLMAESPHWSKIATVVLQSRYLQSESVTELSTRTERENSTQDITSNSVDSFDNITSGIH